MASDVAEIIRLEHESPTAAHWTDQHYESFFAGTSLSAPRLILVAVEQDGPVAGFLVARNVFPEWELENIVVAPDARGKGVGASLLTALLARVASGGGGTVFLEVRESNTTARCLYEKVGFEPTGRRIGYYSSPPEDAVLYSKTLQTQTMSG